MKAVPDSRVIAESDHIVEAAGYPYLPRDSVRMAWLERVEKTESDRTCPHGVQFYDMVIEGERHPRAAWSYESPRPACNMSGGILDSGRMSEVPERNRCSDAPSLTLGRFLLNA